MGNGRKEARKAQKGEFYFGIFFEPFVPFCGQMPFRFSGRATFNKNALEFVKYDEMMRIISVRSHA
jgi:hypothetical protein